MLSPSILEGAADVPRLEADAVGYCAICSGNLVIVGCR